MKKNTKSSVIAIFITCFIVLLFLEPLIFDTSFLLIGLLFLMIGFIIYLCYKNIYEICNDALQDMNNEEEKIKHICDLYNESFIEINKKYQGKDFRYNEHFKQLCDIALTQGQDAAHNFLHNEVIKLVYKKM